MKKFDLFLFIIACGLIGYGFYFSKSFRTEADVEINATNSNSSSKAKSSRLPTKSSDESTEMHLQKENKVDLNPEKDFNQKFLDRYVHLKQCISSQDCDFSQEDPRSYELDIYQEINNHLKNLDKVSQEIKIKVMISAAKMSDGFVKETVLKQLIKDKLYSDQWRDLILDEYISHHNARLIPEVIEYFKVFSSIEDKAIIHERIFSEISNGSPKVANALSENLKQLLDNKSASYYKAQLSNLEDGPIKNNLNRQIIDYEMLSSAG